MTRYNAARTSTQGRGDDRPLYDNDMWYRVFSPNEQAVDLGDMLERLHAVGLPATGSFRGDDLGWTSGELRLDRGTPVYVERYLTKEDDLRDDLNTWAAWAETQDHAAGYQDLMQRIIATKQLMTLRKPIDCADEATVERLCEEACLYLARQTAGIWQADGKGFLDADGNVLVPEY
ncbi:MAG: hypothetical protein U0746_04580 [Gemmataceae bacterium]